MKHPVPRVNGYRFWTVLALSLVSACSAASVDETNHRDKKPKDASPTVINIDPGVTRLAKEFEPRILAVMQSIARDNRISRNAVETILGAKFNPEATPPGRSNVWELSGPLSPGHGFRIALKTRKSDVLLSVYVPAASPSGCYLDLARLRPALVEQSHLVAHERPIQGLRPHVMFTEGQSITPSTVVIRLFDQDVAAPDGKSRRCIHMLDVSAPGAGHG
ncbi:hypothetical protein [Lysobacter capsici]|uniref:hypothetical protein n=1 Tax=Lysobacter capsici TaxID=435897 RepID=UPI001BFFE6B9|nr:hypothetical protein [Lysobacter capsici]QWF15119.1 hypothetical protein KME82_15055 [Lysobacter capsici]